MEGKVQYETQGSTLYLTRLLICAQDVQLKGSQNKLQVRNSRCLDEFYKQAVVRQEGVQQNTYTPELWLYLVDIINIHGTLTKSEVRQLWDWQCILVGKPLGLVWI